MLSLLKIEQRNLVLRRMAMLLKKESTALLNANQIDLKSFDERDLAMYDRLKVDDDKIEGMIASLNQLASQEDPVGRDLFHFRHENGLQIFNRTAAFGTVMIIYESRPDVTVEAAGIAFKSGNKILLKGGKESFHSNLTIVKLWHRALNETGISIDWISYLNFNREETQRFLRHPDQKIDLIIPRGGEKLIEFVKQHATCPVIVSGRGNNFVYVHKEADLKMALAVIINAKVSKISACNAVDKVLIDEQIPDKDLFVKTLISALAENKVSVLVDRTLSDYAQTSLVENEAIWREEFLDYKIVLGMVSGPEQAIEKINKYGGGHSAAIITENNSMAGIFMEGVDSAAVYHNASTRFTDGFQFGLGGELAISTDKLHQRGPIGLTHLVTNKWYVYGEGQIR